MTDPVIYVDDKGALHSRVSSEQVEAILGPHIDHIRHHRRPAEQAAPKAEPLTDVQIDDAVISSGLLDCLQDPYDAQKNGNNYSSVILDIRKVWRMAEKAALATPPTGVEGVSDERILHLWDTRVGDPTPARPLTDADKLMFARAVLAAQPVAGHQGEGNGR